MTTEQVTIPNPYPSFAEMLARYGVVLGRQRVETLQVNMGKLCNQACHHCHVDAGPKRTEIMTAQIMDRLIVLIAASPSIRTVDLTGGAPELNPLFRRLVLAAREKGLEVIDRCNLTVLFEAGQEDTPEFLAQNGVKIIASLPCYTAGTVDKQRGRGVFDKSIKALQRLNQLGYAQLGTGLTLDLVYNPIGASLPPAQAALEADYKARLAADFGIQFSRLLTLTNMPIARFLHDLERRGEYQEYMNQLCASFNPNAAANVMCRTMVSVGWDGRLYDCDFNQMLEMGLSAPSRTIWDIDSFSVLEGGAIRLDSHCYGCTAGAGSSCGGALS